MKKLLLFTVAALFGAGLFAQDCSDLFISEYTEGYGNNKSMEIYNPTNFAIELNDTYRLIRWSNGNDLADHDITYVLPLTGTIAPYGVMVMIQDTTFPGQDTLIDPALRAKANFLAPANYDAGIQGCKVVFWNGDDAVSLQKLIADVWTDIDILGEIGVRPVNWNGTTSPSGGWDDTAPYADGQGTYLTKFHSLIRKPGIKHGVDREVMGTYGPNSWNALLEYDSIPNMTFDSLGQHTCDCKLLGVHENRAGWDFSVYPNPMVGADLFIRSPKELSRVEVLNAFGAVLSDQVVESESVHIRLPEALPQGIYMVRVTAKNQGTASQKLLVN